MGELRVLSASSDRADLGMLKPVWSALSEAGVGLEVLLTGSHVLDDIAARALLPVGVEAHTAGASLGGTSGLRAAKGMAAIAAAAAEHVSRLGPDVVLIAGDRLDMLPVATATMPFNTPLAHLAGGDLTLGAVDDRIRHALSKLSHLHFTVTAEAARRLYRMGEEPWRVHVSGAPNLDTLSSAERLDAGRFASEVGLPSVDGLRLVTVHPETNAADPLAPARAVLTALDEEPAPTLMTASNTDPGGAEITRMLVEFALGRDWAVFVSSLGARLYANALRHARMMVGNSSSGIIEAPLFGLPVINVGRRQDGRARDGGVRDVPADPHAIAALLREPPSRGVEGSGAGIYGDGRAGERIAAVLATLPERERLLRKDFFEGDAEPYVPWEAM